ncbi:hypothetical protein ABEB36_006561 [Hypothenemus hampei]|uniref:Uncharacterized protein n=2 Tax=Hypothenemus hampei TaxID=57062 RepID=A0ABD1EQX3_HYPHA
MHGYPVMQVVQYHIPPAMLPPHYAPHAAHPPSSGLTKYVFWCCACGGLTTILGALFLGVYFLLRSYTSTLGYFETIPSFVPAAMLILTGLCVISLSSKKNRYSYLIKVCGICCLVCALTCVLVTITTTVIHMNRLQTLRECVYTQKTRTCTCYSVLLEAQSTSDDGSRYIFDSTPDCEVIHGALYSCLRAMFGLSVSGILVCIFSCMLVYQLLSHEKKKMYWEQLEMRCRSFYQQQQQSIAPSSTQGSLSGPPAPSSTYCSCCEECRYATASAVPQIYPWDPHERFWSPGRVGNFYSPNPEELPPGNSQDASRRPGWSWRRLPWTRTNAEDSRENSLQDSQYGFGNNTRPNDQSLGSAYTVLDNRPPVGGVYVWGPPPPYSDPNSPARRLMTHHQSPLGGGYHHVHHHHEAHCQMNERSSRRSRMVKDNYENTVTEPEVHQVNENESTDTSIGCLESRTSHHTLPVRKAKKRSGHEAASVKSSGNSSGNRINVQNVFPSLETGQKENEYHEPINDRDTPGESEENCRYLPRLQGVENAAFQKQESPRQKTETTESEVYFADVSSCCNISVRNDGQDSSLYEEAMDKKNVRLMPLKTEPQEDDQVEYLGQRRTRLPFSVANDDPCLQLLPTDISQNSLCSSVQTPLTETTDDGTISPQDREAYFLAPDAQYEIIPETTNSNQNNYFHQKQGNHRRNLGTNISTLIHNLGANPGGLLYGEEEVQGQGCHSDGTIDSGWQSGSEKPLQEAINCDNQAATRPVNV